MKKDSAKETSKIPEKIVLLRLASCVRVRQKGGCRHNSTHLGVLKNCDDVDSLFILLILKSPVAIFYLNKDVIFNVFWLVSSVLSN